TDPWPQIFSGTWEGRIAAVEAGQHGFGYDPLFWLPEHGCTAAQLEPSEKARLSHRAQAAQALRAFLQDSLTTRHG
ncbi:MAG TPA: non-canonical purine NTP pyrophosphatase, partial [Immundisolibacter sp.]